MNVIVIFTLFLATAFISAFAKKYPNECGPRKTKMVGSKKIDVVTDCIYGSKSISEYYKGKLHGKTTHLDEMGRIKSIQHYENDKEHGLAQVFDSLGNVVGIEHFHNGKQVGEIRRWHRPDQLSEVIPYDSSGRLHGKAQKWWPNGHLMSEEFYVADRCTSTTEYYSNGKKRSSARFYRDPDKPIARSKVVDAESWSWSGQSIAKVVGGKGTLIFLPYNFEDSTKQWVGMVEEYQDSVVVKRTRLDSAAILKYK